MHSQQISNKYIANNNINITQSVHYNTQIYDAIEELADLHINLIKEKYNDDWNIEYKEIEPLYEKLVEMI